MAFDGEGMSFALERGVFGKDDSIGVSEVGAEGGGRIYSPMIFFTARFTANSAEPFLLPIAELRIVACLS